MPGEPTTLRDVLSLRAGSDPDRLAFANAGRRLTFGELAESAASLAGGLRRAGVGTGDRVALVMSAGVGFAEAFWALQLLGATPCAFNPSVPADTTWRRAERIRPRMVLSDQVAAAVARARPVALEPESALGGDDLAFLQPTSGTSGEPRAAMVRHRNVLAYLRASHDALEVHPHDVLVSWVPPWHDLGLVRFIIAAVCFGNPCHIVAPSIGTIGKWLETISDVGGTVSGAPDFAYRLATRLVDPRTVNLASLRLSTNGGEAVRRTTVEAFEERFDAPGSVSPAYGLAEATLGATASRPSERWAVDAHGNVSCGTPLPGVELRIDGEGPDPGEILVRSEQVFAGYFDDPEGTQDSLRDGWLHTGDVGYLDAQGRLYVLGRRRAMLKRGGAVIAPRELEEAAQAVDGVRIAAAVSIGYEAALTEAITVVVEADPSKPVRPLEAAVRQAIVHTSGFGPEHVRVVAPRTIPRTANGKVRHDRLRAQLAEAAIS